MSQLVNEVNAEVNPTGAVCVDADADKPETFCFNLSGLVCLPLMVNNRLVMIEPNQIKLQLEAAEVLKKAFAKFPYLTTKRIAKLAQLCSLHPDQVRVWFMEQRLRYCISWDDTTIDGMESVLDSDERDDETTKVQQKKKNKGSKKSGKK